MTFAKMLRVMEWITEEGCAGHIGATGGGELRLNFVRQPEGPVHRYLLARGFVHMEDDSYIYRPSLIILDKTSGT